MLSKFNNCTVQVKQVICACDVQLTLGIQPLHVLSTKHPLSAFQCRVYTSTIPFNGNNQWSEHGICALESSSYVAITLHSGPTYHTIIGESVLS